MESPGGPLVQMNCSDFRVDQCVLVFDGRAIGGNHRVIDQIGVVHQLTKQDGFNSLDITDIVIDRSSSIAMWHRVGCNRNVWEMVLPIPRIR